ncbi:MAG: hypothetical protein KAG28_06370 [Cocleimonas sp.]|nr:hypothetical protein [Cocleimonas sp.]
MSERKIEFDAECFGTVDKETKESCRACDYSKQCKTFKPKLTELKEGAVGDHLKAEQDKEQRIINNKKRKRNQLIISFVLFIILIIVFVQVSKNN